jgi:hypothetical protein
LIVGRSVTRVEVSASKFLGFIVHAMTEMNLAKTAGAKKLLVLVKVSIDKIALVLKWVGRGCVLLNGILAHGKESDVRPMGEEGRKGVHRC